MQKKNIWPKYGWPKNQFEKTIFGDQYFFRKTCLATKYFRENNLQYFFCQRLFGNLFQEQKKCLQTNVAKNLYGKKKFFKRKCDKKYFLGNKIWRGQKLETKSKKK